MVLNSTAAVRFKYGVRVSRVRDWLKMTYLSSMSIFLNSLSGARRELAVENPIVTFNSANLLNEFILEPNISEIQELLILPHSLKLDEPSF